MNERLRNIQDIGANFALNAANDNNNLDLLPRNDITIPMAQFQTDSDGSLLQFVLRMARDSFYNEIFKCKRFDEENDEKCVECNE